MANDNTIKINRYKLNHLFKNIRKLNGGKNLIAKKLGITTPTLDEYLRSGEELLNKYEKELEYIYEIDIDEIDEEIQKTKLEYVDEFLEYEGSLSICDKNKNAFEVYFLNKKELKKEEIIYDYQKEIIENIKYSDDEKEDDKIKILLLFKLIYDRAQMSLDEELLYFKNRYAKTSSKHLGFVVKDLERRNKEDFGDKKESDDKKQVTFNQINNFTHFSIEREKYLKLTQQEKDIIDVETIKEDD